MMHAKLLPLLAWLALPLPAAEPLRAVTFNIRYGTAADGPNHWNLRRDKVLAALREESAHVVGLQEALRFQLDALQAGVPGYQELGVGREDGRERGEYSPLLVATSRLEVVSWRADWLSDTPEVPGSRSWGNTLPRLCTSARLRDRGTGRLLHVINTHFDHQSAPARARSAAWIVAQIQALPPDIPALVLGDFNATPASEPIRILLASPLRDAVALAAPDLARQGTFHGWSDRTDGSRIDYLFTTPGLRPARAWVRPDPGPPPYTSDHRLVGLDFSFE
jgi:endonuclease/exonuclease/phosphatase family metal-dependent hydrolase